MDEITINPSENFDAEILKSDPNRTPPQNIEIEDGDDDGEVNDDNISSERKGRGCARSWTPAQIDISDGKELEEYLKKKGFRKETRSKSKYGLKVFFKCLFANCEYYAYILHSTHRQRSILFWQENGEHEHEKEELSRGLSRKVKIEIQKLMQNGIRKPKQLYAVLSQNESLKSVFPTMRQIRQYVYVNKLHKIDENGEVRNEESSDPSQVIKLREMYEWCEQHKDVSPTELTTSSNNSSIDQPFVVGYEMSGYGSSLESDQPWFRFLVSSKRLLSLASANSTCNLLLSRKLKWKGYHLLMLGVSDVHRHIHPLGVALLSSLSSEDFAFLFRTIATHNLLFKPTHVISNIYEQSIQTGFQESMHDYPRFIFDSTAFLTDIEDELLKIDDIFIRKHVMKDVRELQRSDDINIFQHLASLFDHKWRSKTTNANLSAFLNYFMDKWAIGNASWVRGYDMHISTANSDLHSLELRVFERFKIREHLNTSVFFSVISDDLVREWSEECDLTKPIHSVFHNTLSLTFDVWKHAYSWAKGDYFSIRTNRPDEYFIQNKNHNLPDSTFQSASKDDVDYDLIKSGGFNERVIIFLTFSANSSFPSFDEYLRRDEEMIRVLIPEGGSWKKGVCSCDHFSNTNLCHHLIGMAIRLGLTDPPDDVKLATNYDELKKNIGGKSKGKKAAFIQLD